MGALAGAEGSGTPISDPVVYQLVRVEGDGSLVPATDDEVIEVEHLLEDDTKETFTVQDLSHGKGCVSNKVLSSMKNIEGLEGLSQLEDAEISSQKSNARLEYIEQMLQKVKHEERLRLSHESLHSFPGYIDIDDNASDHLNKLAGCEGLKSENISDEAVPVLRILHGRHNAQSESTEACLEPTTEPSSHIELSASVKPGISISKGNIRLDNLTVVELQEVFRMTFGRQTTVKDKLWLKRRLAMGLRNSYDLPITNATFKDKSAIHSIGNKQSLSRVQESKFDVVSLSTSYDIEVKNVISLEASSRLTTQNKDDHTFLSAKKLRRSVEECVAKDENLLMDQIAFKRVRKPTRRYIEELPQIGSRECIGTLSYSDKNSGRSQPILVPQIRPIHNIGSQSKTFVTRQDFIGGAHIQIPFVSRVRRGCPRKNFMALMNTFAMQSKIGFKEAPDSEEEKDLEHRKTDLSGDISYEYADTLPSYKLNARRKHHRAWTLAEVIKLVEGVARYGTGRWSEIKRVSFSSHSYRTPVDLKDKWRNLLRASFTQNHTDKGVRKQGLMSVPTSVLLRVRDLAELHSKPRIEFGPSKFAIHSDRVVQKKGSGFL